MSAPRHRALYVVGLLGGLILVAVAAGFSLFVVAGGEGESWRRLVFRTFENHHEAAPADSIVAEPEAVALEDSAAPAPAAPTAPVRPAAPGAERPSPVAPATEVPVETPPPVPDSAAAVAPAPMDTVAPVPPRPPAPVVPLPDRILARARELAWARRFEPAEAAFDSALDLSGHRPDIALARARAIGWSGDYGRAADALLPLVAEDSASTELRLERARYLWWAGRAVEADSVLTELLRERPGVGEARDLRQLVRRDIDPSVDLARRWAEESGLATDRLLLARALVRDGRAPEALSEYQNALAEPGALPRENLLEAVGVAMGQDSLGFASAMLDRYLRDADPQADDVRLRLARALSWQGRFDEAVAQYDRLIRRSDDAGLRFERAQALGWSGHYEDAERDLAAVLTARPADPAAYKLLGDLERWRGEPALALTHYRRAAEIDPDVEGLSEAVLLARQQLAAREAPPPAAPRDQTRVAVRWTLSTEAFGDSESFRWFGARATHRWPLGAAFALGITVDQGFSQGPTLLGSDLRSFGLGTGLTATWRLRPGLLWDAQVGLRRFDDFGTFGTWGLGLRYGATGGGRFSLSYEHEPAVRQAATIASLQAGTEMDRLQLGAGLSLGAWIFDGQGEVQRFASDLGTDFRYAASAVLRRPLGAGLSAAALVRAIWGDGSNTFSETFGQLYWSPEYYVAPAVQLAFWNRINERWSFGLRATPGYAFVRERSLGIRRFGENTATMETGLSVLYTRGGWTLDLSTDWGGAIPSGYQAAAVRLQLSGRVP